MSKKVAVERSKSELIREQLNKGVDAPAAIAKEIKTEYGMDINPKYISVIKSNIKGNKKRRNNSPNILANYIISSGSVEKAIEKLQAIDDPNLVQFLVYAGDVKSAVSMIEDAKKRVAPE